MNTIQYQDNEMTALLSVPDSHSKSAMCGTTTTSLTETTINNNNSNTNTYCTTSVSSYGAISDSKNIGNDGSILPKNKSRRFSSVSSSSEVYNEEDEGGLTSDIDIEGGNNVEIQIEQQHQQRWEDPNEGIANNATTINDSDDNTTGDEGGGEGGNNIEQTQSQSNEAGAEGEGESSSRDGAIGNLTRRLRCLFSTITWPIVPLGTIASLALLWVLYAASSLDLQKSCSHPLHSYALVSLVLVAYIPNHSQVRSHIFQYSRERDGPIRPARVRVYDQFFHTICLLYVYTGVTLIQTCREDITVDKNSIYVAKNDIDTPNESPLNTCEATCPNLFQALSVYVATLELFTFALILPLLFLPCIYLWFLQRATAEADDFALLQDRLQEEEALLSNGGVTTGEILESLEVVKIVSRTKHKSTVNESSSSSSSLGDIDPEQQQLWIIPHSTTLDSSVIGTKSDAKECCICMSDFCVQKETDLEDGLIEENENSRNNKDKDRPEDYNNNHNIVDCNSDDDLSTCLTKEFMSELCVQKETDLGVGLIEDNDKSNSKDKDRPEDDNNIHNIGEDDFSTRLTKEYVIVQTRCGHVFHHACLKGWVGGMWNITSNNNSNNSNGNGNSNSNEDSNQDWRQRKARKIFCPLCREDLRPSTS